jgi:Ser/Thr protein kinase RdoA (MazF antagonist)
VGRFRAGPRQEEASVATDPHRAVDLRRVDARFLLPRLPRTAVVLFQPVWAEGLRRAGVKVLPSNAGVVPDLVVAAASQREEALRIGAEHVLLEGRPRRWTPVRSSPTMRHYLPLPDASAPTLVIDLAQRRAAAQGAATSLQPENVAGLVKHLAGRTLLRAGMWPTVRPLYTVYAEGPTTPALVRGAEQATGAHVEDWYLGLPQGREHKRGVFYLRTAAAEPDLVVKFSRLRGNRSKMDREARGLALAERAGPLVSAHSPRLVGEFEVGEHHGSVQTAVSGQTLGHILTSRQPRERKVAHLESVVRWLQVVAASSVTRRRQPLLEAVEAVDASRYVGAVRDDLMRAAAAAPALFMHGDLADGNIVIAHGSLGIVDFEQTRLDGYPLWDLVYMAVNALPLLEGARSEEEHADRLQAIFCGRAPSSGLLFRWLAETAQASGVPPTAVPPLVTLCLMFYTALRDRLADERNAERPASSPLARLSRLWSTDPLLGPAWPAWGADDA